jgi:hypothetical protein
MLAVGAALLASCASLPYLGDDAATGGGDFAEGSRLAGDLNGKDRDALRTAFLSAMESGAPQRWRGGHAVGEVWPESYSIANLRADPAARVPAARGDLNLASTLETELGLHVLTRNSNVRIGPGTEHAIAEVLPSGAGVDVVGKTAGDDWMLIAADGVIRGYVYENLMIKAPGTELELAGGPRREARLCREFRQTVRRYSENDEWTGAACRTGAGWRLAPQERSDEFAPLVLTD